MSLFQDIKKGFPYTIAVPEGMEKFCNWYEANEALPGGDFELFADDGEAITHWSRIPNLTDYFASFGCTGNGSMVGIWQPEAGKQKYMHLSADEGWGTELADNFVDFLRLLAIGYETLGYFSEHTIQELNKLAEHEDLNQGFNPAFKTWVETEFQTTVPTTNLSFKQAGTPFNDWIAEKNAAHEKALFPKHPLFAAIGKKYNETTFYSFPLYKKRTQKHPKGRSVGETHQGLQLLLNDDKTVREILLYGEGKINDYSCYSGGLAGGFNSNADSAQYETLYGKPIKKGKIDGCDYDIFQVKTDFGLREIEIIYNPNMDNYTRYKLMTIR
ncbi:MAG: hypothetical protein RL757_3342 [Bacteroidota bacterium]|jgi:hypothetical protein